MFSVFHKNQNIVSVDQKINVGNIPINEYLLNFRLCNIKPEVLSKKIHFLSKKNLINKPTTVPQKIAIKKKQIRLAKRDYKSLSCKV